MNDGQTRPDEAPGRGRPTDRLDSWKRIASYLKRDVSTVQRWERREGMPIHRHQHDKLASVFAYRAELDAWWATRSARLAAEDAAASPAPDPPAPAPAPASAPALPAARGGPIRRRAGWWAVAAGVALLVTVAFVLQRRGAGADAAPSPLANARFTRLATVADDAQAAALSRDGKLLAFLSDQAGQVDAWIGEIDHGAYRNLTRGGVGELVNPSVRSLGFSPDSTLVSVWSRRADGVGPGDVNVLAVPTAGGALRSYLPGVAEFDWSRSGRLVYHTTAPGDPLFVRAPGSAADRRIYVAPAGIHCHFPLWAPDESYVYFVRGVPPDAWDLWRVAPTGAGAERLTSINARITYPVMTDRHTLLFLATDADGSGPWLFALDVDARQPRRISSGLETYTSLAASADGTRLVATIASPRASIWRVAMPAASDSASAGPPLPLLADGRAPRRADGRLFYVSDRGGRQGLWSMADGSARQIWGDPHGHLVGPPALTPDGRRVAFVVENNGRTSLNVMASEGGPVRVLAAALPLRGSPAWAPDGQSLLIAVVRDGEPRLMRLFLNGDAPLPLLSEYSIDPVWSPDGRFFVYSGADVGTTFALRAAAADGRPYPLPSLILTRGSRRVAFYRDAQTLVILRGGLGHKNLALVRLDTGVERSLLELPGDFVIDDFDVPAAGSELLLNRVEQRSEVALIERPQG